MEKKSLLIIEDNEINRNMLAAILQDEYNIFIAENGRDGIEILRKNLKCISAILLDIQMPVMNGFEFLKYVGDDSVYCKIPVIVTTILNSVEDEKKCLELGAKDFIVKPYDPLIVRLRVENTIYLRECNGIISDLELDALTGFKNRKAYYNDIDAIENDKDRQNKPVGVIFADVNGLKEVNDSFGHEAGDELIASVAGNITDIFPKAERYRFGGDEFVVLSYDTCEKEFNTKADKLSELWNGANPASFGKIWLDHSVNFEKAVSAADEIMYMNKSRYYKDKMHERRRQTMVDTEETLRKIESVSELLPGGFFIYHADGDEQLITFNHELVNLFGCRDDAEFIELTGNSFRGMVHPDDLRLVECDISNQIKQEKDIDRVKYRIVCKDGTVRNVLDYGRFVHTEIYGDVYYVFVNDIT
ncbi:MAG: diguanylate cyclase [Lachnospiraceae bacterium]|nr:diguanylate cyclase [Lachnospiraceae bacterium]